VDQIVGYIQIQNDLFRLSCLCFDKHIDHQVIDLFFADHHCQRRIGPQLVMIIQVFVAQGIALGIARSCVAQPSIVQYRDADVLGCGFVPASPWGL